MFSSDTLEKIRKFAKDWDRRDTAWRRIEGTGGSSHLTPHHFFLCVTTYTQKRQSFNTWRNAFSNQCSRRERFYHNFDDAVRGYQDIIANLYWDEWITAYIIDLDFGLDFGDVECYADHGDLTRPKDSQTVAP